MHVSQGNPLDVLTEIPQPWERLSGESVRAYAAFGRYRDLPPEIRSIVRAAEIVWEKTRAQRRGKFDSLVTQCERWSSAHYWNARAQQHDDMLARAQHESELEARREMGRKHAEAADALLAKGMAALATIEVDEMSVSDVARFVEVGIKLGRLVRGEDDPESAAFTTQDPQDAVRELLGQDAELAKAGARFGAQILRAEREREES